MTPATRGVLVEKAAARYRPAGRFAYFFARGKLAGDPMFATFLDRSVMPDAERLVDLGCGQGLLAAWLWASRGDVPSGTYLGIDRSRAELDRGRRALPAFARFVEGDLATLDADAIGRCDVVALLDVLHYLAPEAQERLLGQVAIALRPGGVLVLRVGDATHVGRSRWSNAVDAVVARMRGHPGALHRRTSAAWLAMLDDLGFDARIVPGGDRGLANVLMHAVRRDQ